MIKTPFKPDNLASSGAVMKKTALALTLVWAILISVVAILQLSSLVTAQSYSNIIIKPDGSIEPTTGLLERIGNTYTFKGDIFGEIMVQKDGIVIDGAGYTLSGRDDMNERGVFLVGPDRSHASCKNVLVKNLRIFNFYTGVSSVGGSNNSIIGNFFDDSGIGIMGNADFTGNLIKHNTFRNAIIFLHYSSGGLDVLTENNFFNCEIQLWLSVAPSVTKNYWSDYATKYPDAKEVGSSGIWDTPYYVSEVENSISLIDHQPLVNPVMDFEISNFSNPNAATSPTPEPQHPETKPSAPEFTVKAVATDMEVTIKNQPVASYENGSTPSLYYMFRFGDSNENPGFWHYDPVYFVLPSTYGGYYKASDSDFTIISLSLEGQHFPSGQIGIQAIALFGNQYPTDLQNGTVYGFEGETSSWSNIQTIELPQPEPFPTTLVIVASVSIVTIVGLGSLVYFKKLGKKTSVLGHLENLVE